MSFFFDSMFNPPGLATKGDFLGIQDLKYSLSKLINIVHKSQQSTGESWFIQLQSTER